MRKAACRDRRECSADLTARAIALLGALGGKAIDAAGGLVHHFGLRGFLADAALAALGCSLQGIAAPLLLGAEGIAGELEQLGVEISEGLAIGGQIGSAIQRLAGCFTGLEGLLGRGA